MLSRAGTLALVRYPNVMAFNVLEGGDVRSMKFGKWLDDEPILAEMRFQQNMISRDMKTPGNCISFKMKMIELGRDGWREIKMNIGIITFLKSNRRCRCHLSTIPAQISSYDTGDEDCHRAYRQ
jgi:hypothetical protein